MGRKFVDKGKNIATEATANEDVVDVMWFILSDHSRGGEIVGNNGNGVVIPAKQGRI